jgi:hypothetical protein
VIGVRIKFLRPADEGGELVVSANSPAPGSLASAGGRSNVRPMREVLILAIHPLVTFANCCPQDAQKSLTARPVFPEIFLLFFLRISLRWVPLPPVRPFPHPRFDPNFLPPEKNAFPWYRELRAWLTYKEYLEKIAKLRANCTAGRSVGKHDPGRPANDQ